MCSCACSSTGWQPFHLTIHGDDNNIDTITPTAPNSPLVSDDADKSLVAICILYIKYHSMGEFIFDHKWADFAEKILNIQYYPKVKSNHSYDS